MANQYRVLNLLRKVDMQSASLKKWAVIKLLLEHPEAQRIQFEGKCHCKGQWLMSYMLPDDEADDKAGAEENCAYYCPSCHFSNAGSRECWTRKLGKGAAS